MTWPEAFANLGMTLIMCATVFLCIRMWINYAKSTHEDDE